MNSKNFNIPTGSNIKHYPKEEAINYHIATSIANVDATTTCGQGDEGEKGEEGEKGKDGLSTSEK
eukprot:461272-Amphidinium_carterae.1